LERVILQGEQGPDRAHFEPQFTRMADERQPAQIAAPVKPPVAYRARRRRQKADLLIMADGREVRTFTPLLRAAFPMETPSMMGLLL
jgi:hypothetical protein